MTATPDRPYCAICDRVPGSPVPKKPELCKPCREKVGEDLIDAAEADNDPDGDFLGGFGR